MRVSLAAVAGAVALLAAGCGGAEVTAAGVDTASLAPRDAGAWVSISLDPKGTQWQRVEDLLAKIPGAEGGLEKMLGELGGGSGLDFRKDVQPALGATAVLVIVKGATEPVLLVQPDDESALERVLAQQSPKPVTADVDGWTAVAPAQAALDAYTKALDAGRLGDDDAFIAAAADFPEEALVRAYVRGDSVGEALGGAAAQAGGLGGVTLPSTGLGTSAGVLGTAAFSLAADEDAFRLQGSVTGSKGAPAGFTPTLLARVPGDALAVVTFAGNEELLSQATGSAGAEATKGIEGLLGVSLDDVGTLLDGEVALYVRPAGKVPEITLAASPKDPAAAERILRQLVDKLAAGGSGATSPFPGGAIGVERAGNVVLVSTDMVAARDFLGSGPKLPQSPRYAAALERAGVTTGGTTAAFLYADVRGLAPLLRTAGSALGSSGGSGGVDDGLAALSAFDVALLTVTVDGDTTRFAGFLGVG